MEIYKKISDRSSRLGGVWLQTLTHEKWILDKMVVYYRCHNKQAQLCLTFKTYNKQR